MLDTYKAFTNHERSDYYIRINNYGLRKCDPSFTPGYILRKCPIIHYVYEGELFVETEGRSFTVSPGFAFVSFPDHVYSYISSAENPCTYRWAEFSGLNLQVFYSDVSFSFDNPLIDDSKTRSLGTLLKEMTDKGKMSGKLINGYSWVLADILSSKPKRKQTVYEKYIEKAIEYISSNIQNKTTVSDVADYLNIDRSYLSRVFNEHMGISIKKYIYNYHMNIAKNMLTYSNMSIKEVASSIGYDDPLDFTKAFHRTFGVSPTKWRNENKIKLNN